MRALLAAILLALCGVSPLAAQGASPGAPLGTREAQAAIRAGRNTSLEPTPRLADGTPNLGRVGTEKGIWGLPGILNFAQMAVDGPEKLHFQATVDDPGAYTRPWTFAWDIPWRAGQELQEYICQENNQYLRRLNDDFGQPIFEDPHAAKK